LVDRNNYLASNSLRVPVEPIERAVHRFHVVAGRDTDGTDRVAEQADSLGEPSVLRLLER
jgi:hypothetical protein